MMHVLAINIFTKLNCENEKKMFRNPTKIVTTVATGK